MSHPRRSRVWWTFLAVIASLSVSPPGLARELSFDERVAAQKAIEQAPEIDSQPTPQATILGGQARFTVIAANDTLPTFQWLKGGVELSDGGTISGATTDVLTLTGVTTADAANYSVVVSNAAGSATSVDAPLTVATPQGGDLDFSFDPGSSINSGLLALAVQPDGKVLIGGYFQSVDGAARGRVARLNPDGSTDHTFGNGLAGANDRVQSVATQPDGRALIAGAFTTVNGVGRNRVARLNADGSLDASFLNGLAGPNGLVWSVVVQPDGRVVIGGEFTEVNGVGRNRVARLNADGSLDATFLNDLAGANNAVYVVAVQSDNRVLIGGGFTLVNGVSRKFVARLNADGSLDTDFPLDPSGGSIGANNAVTAIAVQPDGKVLIGGYFTSIHGVSRNRVARLHPWGTIDPTFGDGLAGANNAVQSFVVQPDGRILIGGWFTLVNGVVRQCVARLNADGSLDTTFLNGLIGTNNIVFSVAVLTDGRVLIGGNFTTVHFVGRNRVARLNANGSLDPSFVNGLAWANLVDAYAWSLAVQPDGRVLVVGKFTIVHGVSRKNIARLNADGSLDTTFLNGLTGADDNVYSVAVQPDGRVLIGGSFTTVNGVSRNDVVRLNADGSLDTAFLFAGTDGLVNSVAVQPDGRVLIGGYFSTVNGVSRNFVARLKADGSLDTTFLNGLAGTNGEVKSVAVQPDGRVLIGGVFTMVNARLRNGVARLNADGSLDTTFLNGLAGTNGQVNSVAVQPDGRVLIGGGFTRVNAVGRNGVARLNANGSLDTTFLNGLTGTNNNVFSVAFQPDGRVLIGGQFTIVNGVSRNYVAGLNPDGSLDTTFVNGLAGANSDVFPVVVQADGRVLIGGLFTSVNGVGHNYVARLYGSTPSAPTITVEPSAQVSYDGCCAVFHVTATGTPRDYQWRKDGVDLADGGNVSGATSDTLRIAGVSAAEEGDYSVVVSNVLGSDASPGVALTVAPVPQCKVATCDPVLGCVLVDALDGANCSDSDACTQDSCQSGACSGTPGTAPADVASVIASKSGETASFTWPAIAGATTYDTLRGRVQDWPVGSHPETESCVDDVTETSVSDTSAPDTGEGFWYLIRAGNACGNGGYGFQGVHGAPTVPRLSGTCP